ncbi:MAG: DMT family transporter [Candidatus Zixiibacteriota bacterium]|nr:MAG: DMT family transporter [candidate division Zixibacteria bacterium]
MSKQITKPAVMVETEDRNPNVSFIVFVLLMQQTLGGITFPVAKFGLTYIEPFTFAFFRFVLSSIVLLAISGLTRHRVAVERGDYWKLVGLGILIIPFNQAMYLVGQSLTGAGHGSLLFATVPVWILIGAMFKLREKPSLWRIVGIVVAMSGVIIVMTAGAVRISTEYLWGDLIILIAVLAWAYYTVLGKPLVRKYGAIRVTAYALASGSAVYFPFGLYMALKMDYSAVPIAAWASVAYVALGVSVGAYVLWYWVLKYMEASRIAVFHNMQPLIASAVAYVWLDEPLGLPFIIGGTIALAGVIIAERDSYLSG